MVTQEGVIKFELVYQQTDLPPGVDIADLQYWFDRCHALGLIDRDPTRYGGYAFGNISQRHGTGFLISGTQTGGYSRLSDQDIAWVSRFDVERNRLVATGPAQPSSESMTHGQIYDSLPDANFVIHVHSPLIWHQAEQLGLAITAPEAAYGTVQMVREVRRLLAADTAGDAGCLSMGGHEDGILFFGPDADRAGKLLLRVYDEAITLSGEKRRG